MTQEPTAMTQEPTDIKKPLPTAKKKQVAEKNEAAQAAPSEEKETPSTQDSASPIFIQAAETLHNQLAHQSHALFSENVKLSKDFFLCKTASDFLDLQMRILRLNSEAYLNNITKLTESLYQNKKN